tara:strand:+ start:1081 stop:1362 length:282 start_codon:yes stop_codon:yes gene_type:complete
MTINYKFKYKYTCQDIDEIVGINQSGVRSFFDECGETINKHRIIDSNNDYYMTLDEIGFKMGVSNSRVRQIIDKAIKKLQHPKRRTLLKDFLT